MTDESRQCPGRAANAHREQFNRDQRAIEGLPIRLVIAVVVGAAALSIMLSTLDGIEPEQKEEVTLEIDDELLTLENGDERVTLSVVTTDGKPIEDAQILIHGGSALVANGPVELQTGPDSHQVTLTVGPPGSGGDALVEFRDGQARGTLEIEIVPPAGSGNVDNRSNPEITVVE